MTAKNRKRAEAPAYSGPPLSSFHSVTGPGWTLYRGDCLDVLAAMGDKSVAHVVTDPPYDEHTHAAGRRGSLTLNAGYVEAERSRRASISRVRDLGFAALTADQMSSLGQHFGRLARRWVAPFCSLEMISGWKASLEAGGLQYVRTCLWRKVGGAPQFTGDRPAIACEGIPTAATVEECEENGPFVLAHMEGRKSWNGGGKHGFYEVPIVLNRGHGEERLHTTQKPVDLMAQILADFTDPGDIVLDPFAGSGTTGVACIRLGRTFIGIERDPAYFDIACRRLAGDEAKPRPEQPSLFDSLGGAA